MDQFRPPSSSSFPSSALSPYSHSPHSSKVCGCCAKSDVKRWLKHAWLFCKSVIALVGAIIAWLGIWELFDLYFFPRSVGRDILYVLLCGVVMGVCGTYLPNCGIYEDEEAQEDLTKAAVESADRLDGFDSSPDAVPNDEIPLQDELRTQRSTSVSGRDDTVSPIHLSHPSNMDQLSSDPSQSLPTRDEDRLNLIVSDSSPARSMRPLSSVDASPDSAVNDSTQSYCQALRYLLFRLCSWQLFFKVYVASIVSLFASIGFWAGAYNLLIEFFLLISFQNEATAYTLNMVLGWLLMWGTGTLFEQAGLTTEEQSDETGEVAGREQAQSPTRHSLVHGRLRVYIRASIAITGCMMFWLGASMLLELLSDVYYKAEAKAGDHNDTNSASVLHCDQCIDSTPARNAVFIALGFFLFVVTDTMAIHAGIEESNTSAVPAMSAAATATGAPPSDEHRLVLDAHARDNVPLPVHRSRFGAFLAHPLVRHLRAFASLSGVMLLWEGIWDAAFNAEAEQQGWARMVAYTGFGLLALMLTNSFFSNSGVIPPFAMAKRNNEIQTRLAFHLQEKKFLHLTGEGHRHEDAMVEHIRRRESMQLAAEQKEERQRQEQRQVFGLDAFSPSDGHADRQVDSRSNNPSNNVSASPAVEFNALHD